MNNIIESFYGFLVFCGFVLFVPLVLLCVWSLVAVMPANIIAERECLAKGYPETQTTVTLDSYCVNIDGVVTGTVENVEDLRDE